MMIDIFFMRLNNAAIFRPYGTFPIYYWGFYQYIAPTALKKKLKNKGARFFTESLDFFMLRRSNILVEKIQ